MSRKVSVLVTSRLIFNMDEGVEVSEVIDNINYGFDSEMPGAEIYATEILDYSIEDSK